VCELAKCYPRARGHPSKLQMLPFHKVPAEPRGKRPEKNPRDAKKSAGFLEGENSCQMSCLCCARIGRQGLLESGDDAVHDAIGALRDWRAMEMNTFVAFGAAATGVRVALLRVGTRPRLLSQNDGLPGTSLIFYGKGLLKRAVDDIFIKILVSSVKRARRRFCIFPPWAQKSTSSLSMKSADLVSVTFASGTSLTWPPPPCAELSISSVRPHSGLSDKPGVSKNGCSSYAMPEVVLIFYSKFL
jgi:hypothetical protein